LLYFNCATSCLAINQKCTGTKPASVTAQFRTAAATRITAITATVTIRAATATVGSTAAGTATAVLVGTKESRIAATGRFAG
jgi:hypothetical protein